MKQLPYGKWPSPITKEMITEKKSSYSFLQKEQSKLYWLEKRSEEKGRSTLVSLDLQTQEKKEETPGFDVRSKINEYGGGAFLVYQDLIFFTNSKDQGIYVKEKGKIRLVIQSMEKRYAGFCFDLKRNLLYAICEDKSKNSEQTIVRISLQGEEVIVAKGYDFYSSIAIDPNSERLAFLKWNHPNMPWDGNKLMLHKISQRGDLEEGVLVAGSEEVSIFQPKFSLENKLYYLSNETGFSNLYCYNGDHNEAICPMEADFDQPAWLMGFSRYDFIPREKGYDIFCVYTKKGKDQLGILLFKERKIKAIAKEYVSVNYLQADGVNGYLVGSTSLQGETLLAYSWEKEEVKPVIPIAENVDPDWVSIGEEVQCRKETHTIYGFFYPPINPHCKGLASKRPPLIVRCHGGPTGHVKNNFQLETLFWTSRGFAVLDVNYRGSTGYGKAYQDSLKGNWGVFDVNDVCDLAQYVAEKGFVDKDRMAVKGRSAGGFTALASACFRKVFACMVSYYGIADLLSLLSIDHKFELFYNQVLVGKYPEKKKDYLARSPSKHASHITCPVLLFHGVEDKIVPVGQSQEMYEVLRKKNHPVFLTLFEGEGHGFRKKETFLQAFSEELAFYHKNFGLEGQDYE